MSLQLDPRQHAMLAEMGVRLWQPPTPVSPPAHPQPANTPVTPPVAVQVNVNVAVPTPPSTQAPHSFKPLPDGVADMDWAQLQSAAHT